MSKCPKCSTVFNRPRLTVEEAKLRSRAVYASNGHVMHTPNMHLKQNLDNRPLAVYSCPCCDCFLSALPV